MLSSVHSLVSQQLAWQMLSKSFSARSRGPALAGVQRYSSRPLPDGAAVNVKGQQRQPCGATRATTGGGHRPWNHTYRYVEYAIY